VAVPVFLPARNRKGPGWRNGFGTGWLFGLGYFAVAFHWIGFAFLVDAATYLWMMPFMLGALAGGMAIYWGLAAMLAKRLGGSGLAAGARPLRPHLRAPNGCGASVHRLSMGGAGPWRMAWAGWRRLPLYRDDGPHAADRAVGGCPMCCCVAPPPRALPQGC
jgi:hypothetical protein